MNILIRFLTLISDSRAHREVILVSMDISETCNWYVTLIRVTDCNFAYAVSSMLATEFLDLGNFARDLGSDDFFQVLNNQVSYYRSFPWDIIPIP